MAVMLDGRIIEEGPSNEIIAAPKQGRTSNLLKAASALRSSESSSVEQPTLNPPIDEGAL